MNKPIKEYILFYKNGGRDITRHHNIEDVKRLYLNQEVRSSKGNIEVCVDVAAKHIVEHLEHKLKMNIHKFAEEHGMESNGFAYFHNENFKSRNNLPCYIPENAETLDDVFSYLDLAKEVREFCTKNSEYLTEHETDEESMLLYLYENIEWTFPSTYLNELT